VTALAVGAAAGALSIGVSATWIAALALLSVVVGTYLLWLSRHAGLSVDSGSCLIVGFATRRRVPEDTVRTVVISESAAHHWPKATLVLSNSLVRGSGLSAKHRHSPTNWTAAKPCPYCEVDRGVIIEAAAMLGAPIETTIRG
jgi:hypothetical protein